MKKLKVIVSIICFFFYITAFLYAVDFKTQADVDNPANWEALNAEPGIFYGDFFLSTSVPLQSAEKLSTNNSNIIRTLTANKNNNFFLFLKIHF